MKTNYVKSTGQGNLLSKLDSKIFENNSCIISRLHSRTLTGRNIQIKVHEHFGDRLHLFWQTKSYEIGTTRSIGHEEFIQKNNDIKRFCTDLELGELENLCSCVSPNFYDPAKGDGKIEKCVFSRHYHSCPLEDCRQKAKEKINHLHKITNLGYCIEWK
jgi:hypothetical protein